MPYPYGMQGSPAVGNGLGGLPRRPTVTTAARTGAQATLQRVYAAAQRPTTYAFGLLSETVTYQVDTTTSVSGGVTASWATYPFASASSASLVRIPTTNFVIQFGSVVRLFTISSETSSAISLTYVRAPTDFYSTNRNAKVLYYKFLSPTLVHLLLKYSNYVVYAYTIQLQASDITVVSSYQVHDTTSDYFMLFPLYSLAYTTFVVIGGISSDMTAKFFRIDSAGSVVTNTQSLGALGGMGIEKWSNFGVGINSIFYTYNEGPNTVDTSTYTGVFNTYTQFVSPYTYSTFNYVACGDGGGGGGVIIKNTDNGNTVNAIIRLLGTDAGNSVSDAYGSKVLLTPATGTSGYQYEGKTLQIVSNS